MYLIYFFRGK